MVSVRLPVLALELRAQRYSCHGCGNCCRDFTVQLREADLERIRQQDWERKLGEPVTVRFRGRTYLRQREDGSCIFLLADGKCRIHAEHGFAAKPVACQLFPFHITPQARAAARASEPKASGSVGAVAASSIQMGLNFACQSVLENKGAALPTHLNELSRMTEQLEELRGPIRPPLLTERLRADADEVASIQEAIDDWLTREHSLNVRLDGLAWLVGSLTKADLSKVRGARLEELAETLTDALPEELAYQPVEGPTSGQVKMLRQAAFTRTDDLKIARFQRLGSLRTRLDQLARSRRFRVGRGTVPHIGVEWPSDVRFADVEKVQPVQANTEDALLIDSLLTRWLRASVLGGRCWGAGYYGWPIVRGLNALVLNVAVVSWLARVHAAGAGRTTLLIDDVRAALGRVDRTSGRAPWLGSAMERMRLNFLQREEGLRRLVGKFRMTNDE